MVKWDLRTEYVKIGTFGGCDPSKIWNVKDKSSGLSAWDGLKTLAREGWELVSVTPLAHANGETIYVLYTFKRPILDNRDI